MNENENQVQTTAETGTEKSTESKKVRKKLKTRCYYTDYVNHAIRFFLTTPETLKLEGKRKADLENWVAVQAVFHGLGAEKRAIVEEIYRSNYRIPDGVRMYCEKTGADETKIWILITKTSAAIAKRRGLVYQVRIQVRIQVRSNKNTAFQVRRAVF